MAEEQLVETIEQMVRIPSILHRKLHRDLFRVALEEIGVQVSPHHMMILRMVREFGPLSSSEIGENLSIAKSQMTHSVDRLIKLGFVEREHSLKDRRKIQITITDKGIITMERIDNAISNRLKEKLAILSSNELEELAQCFQFIAVTFSKL